MARGDLKTFSQYPYKAGLGSYNNSTDTFKLALLSDAYGDISADDATANLSAFNEVAAGGQYSAGGNALPGNTWSITGGVTKLDFTDFSMSKGQGNPVGVKTALIINSTSGSDAYHVIDLTTDGVTAIDVQNNDLNITLNANGTVNITVS